MTSKPNKRRSFARYAFWLRENVRSLDAAEAELNAVRDRALAGLISDRAATVQLQFLRQYLARKIDRFS